MTNEYLMIPRFECVSQGKNHYPGSNFNIGDVLKQVPNNNGWWFARDGKSPQPIISIKDIQNNSHLFKELMWYEKREGGLVIKVISWEWDNDTVLNNELFFNTDDNDIINHYPNKHYEPATEQEYNEYLDNNI